MAVTYKDYYDILGVGRNATADEIKRAYRKLAVQYHPDRNKDADAHEKFSGIGEAYEVLGDPEKRSKYDQLGASWKSGQEFRPPPGFEGFAFKTGQGGGFSGGNVNDFFEALFGQRSRGASVFEDLFAGGDMNGQFGGAATMPRHGHDHEAEITLSLEEAFHGGSRSITLTDGGGQHRTFDVKVPRGITTGKTIRLKGQGGAARGEGGSAGDLMLRVRIAPHPTFEQHGHDLVTDVLVTPWEAALGAKVDVPTLDGAVTLTVPPGTQSGQKLRLKGKGMPMPGSKDHGDLLAQVKIVVPRTLTDEQRELYERLRDLET